MKIIFSLSRCFSRWTSCFGVEVLVSRIGCTNVTPMRWFVFRGDVGITARYIREIGAVYRRAHRDCCLWANWMCFIKSTNTQTISTPTFYSPFQFGLNGAWFQLREMYLCAGTQIFFDQRCVIAVWLGSVFAFAAGVKWHVNESQNKHWEKILFKKNHKQIPYKLFDKSLKIAYKWKWNWNDRRVEWTKVNVDSNLSSMHTHELAVFGFSDFGLDRDSFLVILMVVSF